MPAFNSQSMCFSPRHNNSFNVFVFVYLLVSMYESSKAEACKMVLKNICTAQACLILTITTGAHNLAHLQLHIKWFTFKAPVCLEDPYQQIVPHSQSPMRCKPSYNSDHAVTCTLSLHMTRGSFLATYSAEGEGGGGAPTLACLSTRSWDVDSVIINSHLLYHCLKSTVCMCLSQYQGTIHCTYIDKVLLLDNLYTLEGRSYNAQHHYYAQYRIRCNLRRYLFSEIVKKLAVRIFRGFTFCEYVARLILRPIFRKCELTHKIRENKYTANVSTYIQQCPEPPQRYHTKHGILSYRVYRVNQVDKQVR